MPTPRITPAKELAESLWKQRDSLGWDKYDPDYEYFLGNAIPEVRKEILALLECECDRCEVEDHCCESCTVRRKLIATIREANEP